MSKTLEVFRDLYLSGPREKRKNLRVALLNAAVGRWSVDLNRSEELAKLGITEDDVLLFQTQATES